MMPQATDPRTQQRPRNYAGFRPLAAERGLPSDVSDAISSLQFFAGEHGHTFITAREMNAIDWSEWAETVDARIHNYLIRDGVLEFDSKSFPGKAWSAVAGDDAPPDGTKYPEGTEWTNGQFVCRVERMRRSDVLESKPLSDLLARVKDLGEERGDTNVRLVVWFDS